MNQNATIRGSDPFSDGFGSFPDKTPNYPVLWIMTPQARTKIQFGEVIQMTEKAA
jgi:predicted metal-dependent peptidase